MQERLIFVLSPGRCATGWLAQQMNLIPGVVAFHEPRPGFVHPARKAYFDKEGARRFWEDRKLPGIRAVMKRAKAEVYVETSHVIVKGMVEPLLEVGVVPDVICVWREPREVALSFWRRRSVPGRSRRGEMYLLHPRDLRNWQTLTDYQLCYWHAMEAYQRSDEIAAKVAAAGGKAVGFNMTMMTDLVGFHRLCDKLELPWPSKFVHEKINAAPDHVHTRFPPGDLDEQERQVRDLMDQGSAKKLADKPYVNVYLVNTGGIRAELSDWLAVWARDERFHVKIEETRGFPVTHNRNQAVLRFLEGWGDFMLMVDEDVVPSRNPLDLVEKDLDVVIFPTPIWKAGGAGTCPVVMNIHPAGNDLGEELPDAEMVPLRAGGTGAILIKRRVLENPRLRWPFWDKFDEDGVRRSGSDIEFTRRAVAAGYGVWAPMNYACGHYKTLNLLEVLQAFDDYFEALLTGKGVEERNNGMG